MALGITPYKCMKNALFGFVSLLSNERKAKNLTCPLSLIVNLEDKITGQLEIHFILRHSFST